MKIFKNTTSWLNKDASENWFSYIIDRIDPCQIKGPCLASYVSRFKLTRKLYSGDIEP